MKGILRKAKSVIKKSSPTILTCMGVVGVVGTAVMAVRATPTALEIIKMDSRLKHDGDPYAYTPAEAVRSSWRCYVPAALVGLSTITCIISVNVLNKKNQASIISAYAMLNESYQQYRKSAKKVYGEEADRTIVAQMAKDTYVSADGYSLYSSEFDPESERILCHDLHSQRYFTSTMAAILNAQYHINRNLCLRGSVTINELYEFMGLEKIKNGDEIGWSLDDLMDGGIMWLDFENTRVVMEDGMECCVISALWSPNKFDCEPCGS